MNRQLSQIINAQATQYYSLFNELHHMIGGILLNIEESASSNGKALPIYQEKLLKCLVCIYDLIFICEDTSSLKIQHLFPEILEHVTSVEHIINIYAIASILFFCKTASQSDFEMYPKILFHGTPFMKFFDIYSMDIAKVYAKCEISDSEVRTELRENFLKIAKHGKEILDYFESSMEEEEEIKAEKMDSEEKKPKINYIMPPKLIAQDIMKKHDLKIEFRSYEYYNLLGEILLGCYIHKNYVEDIISVLTAMQSFCGKDFLT